MTLKERVERLEKAYGSIETDGKRFVLCQDAYANNNSNGEAAYYSTAISDSDPVDDLGRVDAYEVMWSILPDWDGDDECCACDWDNPEYVRKICGYDPEDGRFC